MAEVCHLFRTTRYCGTWSAALVSVFRGHHLSVGGVWVGPVWFRITLHGAWEKAWLAMWIESFQNEQIKGRFTLISDVSVPYQYRPCGVRHGNIVTCILNKTVHTLRRTERTVLVRNWHWTDGTGTELTLNGRYWYGTDTERTVLVRNWHWTDGTDAEPTRHLVRIGEEGLLRRSGFACVYVTCIGLLF
jgi:hypothetical protein